MSGFNYDPYCGLYCGACSIHIAYRTGYKDAFASYWTESSLKESLKSRGIALTESDSLQLVCHGCKSDTLFINCKHCPIRQCASGRKIEHCAIDCPDFPCHVMEDSGIKFEDILKMLPHLKSTMKNVETIKRIGVEQWLAEQESLGMRYWL